MSDLTYLYCLVRAARRLPTSSLAGMPGARGVRVLDAGSRLWAIVSTVPQRAYDEAALAAGLQDLDWVGRHAMAHEAVVERFLNAPAVLPMQLFTLFTSDERALAHVARDRGRIDGILDRVEHQLEWGLRLSFDESAARAAIDARAPADRSGAAYLARKRDLFAVGRRQLAAARSEANRLYRAMSQLATEARRRTATEQGTPGSRLLLDAAFLVPARQSRAFRSAVRQQARTLGSPTVVSLTGPWPPYNFIASARKGAPRAVRGAKARARARGPRS